MIANGLVRPMKDTAWRMRGVLSQQQKKWKRYRECPGSAFWGRPATRTLYKTLCAALIAPRVRGRAVLLSLLPEVPPTLAMSRETGLMRVEPDVARPAFGTLDPLLGRCRSLIASEERRIQKHGSKKQLTDLITDDDLAVYPEFLDFALDPLALAIVSNYLGELPILYTIYYWRSSNSGGAWDNSQLYHCDADDSSQVKIFVHVSDVDEASGPLTVLPANVSQQVRTQIGYRWSKKVRDETIHPLVPDGSEQRIMGAQGTLAFVDTSRVLHFGSRVSSKDRYVVVVQYVTPTHFYVNPFRLNEAYRYAHLAGPEHTSVQQAVLAGVTTPKLAGATI